MCIRDRSGKGVVTLLSDMTTVQFAVPPLISGPKAGIQVEYLFSSIAPIANKVPNSCLLYTSTSPAPSVS